MKCTQRLYLTKDRKKLVAEGDVKAAFLYAVPGDEIPDSAARLFGLVDGALKGSKPAADAEAKAKADAEAAARKAAAAQAKADAEAAAKEAAAAQDKERKAAQDKESTGQADGSGDKA